MTTPFDAALAAILARDPAQLEQALHDMEEAQRFRDEVLPELSPSDCRWFWTTVMTPEQFQQTAGMAVDVAAAAAHKQGLQLGVDYSVGVDEDGLAQLLATEAAYSLIAAALPPERRSVLRALLRVLPD